MAKIKAELRSIQDKVKLVRRTRGRNYTASLQLEGFNISSVGSVKKATVSLKQAVVAKYQQMA